MPVINMPAFSGVNDMPVGLSIVGPRFRDQQLLKTTSILAEVLTVQSNCKITFWHYRHKADCGPKI
ncbi:hypothetical protein CCUS01_02811 [Colletotrichum cuscutae]|uniref:Amidase n=1 Tax=Colletotrichum cuscutae TaxID=1209917 RepID=A0AAI9YC39_9PEZI|nr:hypothetical protein CSPX01_06841 [Colletotrichum filicis]KAK1496464.1 hypothetical protein CCUS01_02811 [Colletotrichum cuscutae]